MFISRIFHLALPRISIFFLRLTICSLINSIIPLNHWTYLLDYLRLYQLSANTYIILESVLLTIFVKFSYFFPWLWFFILCWTLEKLHCRESFFKSARYWQANLWAISVLFYAFFVCQLHKDTLCIFHRNFESFFPPYFIWCLLCAYSKIGI